MNNFDIHEEAQRMAERDSAYAIARRYIETRNDTEQFQRMFARAAEELHAMKAALVGEGEEAPVGPAISLVEKLRSERDALREYPALSLARQQAEGLQEVIGRLEGRLGAIRAAWNECGEWPETYSELSALREAIVGAGKETEGLNESD